MRQSLRLKYVLVAAAVSCVLGAGCGSVYADTGAEGSAVNSSEGLTGNSVQAPGRGPVGDPVDFCGSTVSGVGLLNRAMGAVCGDERLRAPGGRHVPDARTPGVGWRPGDGRSGEGRPGPGRGPDGRRGWGGGRKPDVERRAHSARAPRVGAVARAGASAGSALLASTGARQLGLAVGVGGGLVFGGALLLRRSHRR
ncbi:chaplin family protein [Streptomyces halobius]|uniref:DUF320 domain-containing protein n=1 Tax=Streptomyces halobius TaxID=2879846 RepID=A0ABY4M863_9ACTN|nr:chaplin family protein [Streptomyces halobius]UQA93969.1 DUF320 domain-containing protein [Streptomyces halobius]